MMDMVRITTADLSAPRPIHHSKPVRAASISTILSFPRHKSVDAALGLGSWRREID